MAGVLRLRDELLHRRQLWIAHHDLFVRLRYVDPVLLWLNLVLLLGAAFLPFPTAVLSQSFHEGRLRIRLLR